MSDNKIEYTVKVSGDGLTDLANALERVEAATADTGRTTATAGASVDKLGAAAEGSARYVDALEKSIKDKTDAIKLGLQVEQSEIELSRVTLRMQQDEAQARLQAAKARGDDSAAQRAQNDLARVESELHGLVARGKRAEVAAVQEAVAARRLELAAMGPLTAAQTKELQAAENHVRALRTEAAAADQTAARVRELGNAHRAGGDATDKMAGQVRNMTQVLGQMAAALGVSMSLRELVTAAAQMEQLRSGLTAVTQDAAKAGEALDFVRGVAVRVGADVTEVGKAFLGLSASTRGTAVEGEPTRQVFEAVASAMGKAGKSSAETTNALNALSQMASKGTVQAEELRGQLGEALPGALNAAAKGMGITTQELMKLVEEGKVTASDLFPALSKGLNDLYGAAGKGSQTLTQEMANLKNAVTNLGSSIGESGGLAVLKTGAELAQAAVVSLDAGIVAAGKSIGTVLAAIVNRDFSGLKQAFADIQKEAQDKILSAAQHNDTLRAALKASGDEAVKAALAQQELAAKTAAAAAATAESGTTWIGLVNDYRKVLESIKEQIEHQEKSVIARDAEAKAAVALAGAFGTEIDQRVATAKATAAAAVETEKLAELKARQLAVMQAELANLKALAAQEGEMDAQRKEKLAELEKQIGLRQQDVDKTVAQAQASRLAAEQAKAEAEAYKDNSDRVGELRDAYERARAKADEVRLAKLAGKATTEELTKAELEAGRAALVYRDALQDQLRSLAAKAQAAQASANLEQSVVRLAIEQQKAIYEVAKARGDEATAQRAQNEIRRLEIQLLELVAQAKRAEAQAELAAIQAKRAALIASGELTQAKRLELDAATKAAQAKQIEAQIAEVTANKMRGLAAAQTEAAKAARDQADANNSAADSLNRLTGASEAYQRQQSRETRFVGVLETDINQEIAKRWGDDAVGNSTARELLSRTLEYDNYRKSYGNVVRSDESMDQQMNIGHEIERLQKKLEEELSESRAQKDKTKRDADDDTDEPEAPRRRRRDTPSSSGGGLSSPIPADARAPGDGRPGLGMGSDTGGGSGGNGGGAGITYRTVVNIPREAPTQLDYSDAQSQKRGTDLIRKLTAARSVALRGGRR